MQVRSGPLIRTFAAVAFAAVTIIDAVVSVTAATTTCSTVAACILGQDTAQGPGLEGISASGSAVAGVSTSGHGIDGTSSTGIGIEGRTMMNATSVNNARAGVIGYDKSTNNNPYNSGVSGVSTYGIGVLGLSPNGFGLQGQSTASYGVFGLSSSSTGVLGRSTSGPGTSGFSSSADGAQGFSTTSAGVQGDSTSGFGVAGYSNSSYGVYAQSDGNYGLVAINSPKYTTDGIAILGKVYGSTRSVGVEAVAADGGRPFVANNGSADVASIDDSGNMILSGALLQNGTPFVKTATVTGGEITTFGARTATPTLEDLGSAELLKGRVYVPLRRSFATAIDANEHYFVFVTPQGDNKGLFVTNVSANGFEVRESNGGHSSIAFDYRIVAKPFDTLSKQYSAAARLRQLPSDTTRSAPGIRPFPAFPR